MVFGYIRDVYNYYFGNNYPSQTIIATLKERDKSTALVRYTKRYPKLVPIIRQPQLPETWVETHPSASVCIRQVQSSHEEF